MEALAQFIDGAWWTVLLKVIGAAALAATVTPNKWDNKILKFLSDVLNLAAANFGNAKNKDTD